MAIYDKNGNICSRAYDVQGDEIANAYDVEGTHIWTRSPITLKVMTYNVGGWYIGDGTNVPANKDTQYYNLQNAIIGAQDADILCIEEYWTNFSSNRTAQSLLSQYYPYIEEHNGNDMYFGRAICSKYPIVNYTPHVYDGDASGRYYDMATINVGGILLDVIVTHLTYGSDAQIAQATELFDYSQTLENQFIICGDFNSTIRNPFSERNAAIYNQFLNAGDTLANGTEFGILPTACNSDDWENDKFAIDQIIASPTITIDNVWTDLTKTTDQIQDGKIDHIPLIAEVTIAVE